MMRGRSLLEAILQPDAEQQIQMESYYSERQSHFVRD